MYASVQCRHANFILPPQQDNPEVILHVVLPYTPTLTHTQSGVLKFEPETCAQFDWPCDIRSRVTAPVTLTPEPKVSLQHSLLSLLLLMKYRALTHAAAYCFQSFISCPCTLCPLFITPNNICIYFTKTKKEVSTENSCIYKPRASVNA